MEAGPERMVFWRIAVKRQIYVAPLIMHLRTIHMRPEDYIILSKQNNVELTGPRILLSSIRETVTQLMNE